MCSCVTVISQSVQKARKEYFCGLSDVIGDVEFERGKLSFGEIRSLVTYHRNRRKIKVGDVYVRQFNEQDGERYEWMARKDIYDLLNKYDMFPCSC